MIDDDCPFFIEDSDYFASEPTTQKLIPIGKGGFAKSCMRKTKNQESAIHYFRGEVITENERKHRMKTNQNQCHVHELSPNNLHLDCWRYYRIGLCPLSALNTANGLKKRTSDGVTKAINNIHKTLPRRINGEWKVGIAKDPSKVVRAGEQMFFGYSKAFNTSTQSSKLTLFTSKGIQVSLNDIGTLVKKHSMNSQKTGYCFALTLCQMTQRDKIEQKDLL